MSDSRIETLLEALLNGTDPPQEPMSRVEAYLYALCKKGVGTGGRVEITNLTDRSLTLTDTKDSNKSYMLTIVDGKLTMTEVTE